MDEFKNLGMGYLYNLWNGKIKEYHGRILHRDKYIDHNRIIIPERTYFMALDEHGRVIKKLLCSGVEGEICNKGLWLYESDVSHAAQILINYEEEQIAKLEFQIQNHKELIETLKKEVEVR